MNEDNCFRNLNLTADELKKFGNAFSSAEFRELFNEYLREINDPNNRKEFENEIIQLEHEYGNDVQLIRPIPNYVLKTNADNGQKVYINMCSSENVDTIQFVSTTKNNVPGKNIRIPHVLNPHRNVQNKHNIPVFVYTIVFHPNTLKEAATNPQIKQCVHETALTFIEKSFNVSLDKMNCRISKKLFMGATLPTTIYQRKVKNANQEANHNCNDEYIEPSYHIKYQNEVDLQNSTMDRYCKINMLVPKIIIVEIQLPLLKSIQNTHLDVQSKSINLVNEEPRYKLAIALPYEVNTDNGSAKFDSTSRILRIELPTVERKLTSVPFDKGKKKSVFITEIDEDELNETDFKNESQVNCTKPASSIQSPPILDMEKLNIDSLTEKVPNNSDCYKFLHLDTKYKLPPFNCNYYQNRAAFTINVKNVNYNSFDYQILEGGDGFWLKFYNLGAGHFPMFYALCIVFQNENSHIIQSLDYLIENEIINVYVNLCNNFIPLEYWVGIDRWNLQKHFLNEPDSVNLEIENKLRKMEAQEVDLSVSKFTPEEVTINAVIKSDYSTNERSPVNKLLSRTCMSTVTTTSTTDPAIPEQMKKFEKFERTPEKVEQSDVKSENNNCQISYDQISNLGTFCDNFKNQCLLDNEPLCVSESELQNQSQYDQNCKSKPIDHNNQSWIVDSKNAKKAKRRKKARDKKLLSTNENNCLKKANGGTESETDLENLIQAEDELVRISPIIVDMKSTYKFSDLNSRSILKKNRSFSESSGDELCHVECSRSYSTDDIHFSSDLYSHSVPKKTVRFNDVILKKLYSSDISILEQRKRSKRRFQRKERKASDSDNSETETSASSIAAKRESIDIYNENLLFETSETDLTSLSESNGETSDDQSDNQDIENKVSDVPCSKKNHKRRGKKSARKNASTAKYQLHVEE